MLFGSVNYTTYTTYTYYTTLHGRLFSWLGWCSYLLLEYLGKLQKQEHKTVNHSLEISHHGLNAASLSLFCRCCFGRWSSEQAELFLLPYLSGRSTRYFNRWHESFVTIFKCYKDVYVSSFFPRRARLWNSLPAGWFPLNYDPNGFKDVMSKFIYFAGCFLHCQTGSH